MAVAGISKRSLVTLNPTGTEGQLPCGMVSASLQGHCSSDRRNSIPAPPKDLPKGRQGAVAVLAVKGGFLALSPQLFKAFKQIQIPSEDWTPALEGLESRNCPGVRATH